MYIFYDLIFLLFTIFYFLPYYLIKRKINKEFVQRLGFFPEEFTQRLDESKNIWIHGVSVGEIQVANILGTELKNKFKDTKILYSTTTKTGFGVAKKFLTLQDYIILFPLDFSLIVKKIISKVKPIIFISVESEIWPNLICHLNKKNIPIIVVNGKMSSSSFRKFKKVKYFIKPVLSKIDYFYMQSKEYTYRIKSLGISDSKIGVSGNIKFDQFSKKEESKIEKQDLKLFNEAQLFVAGSTHPPEEEFIIQVYKKLFRKFPGLRLLIAPRHIERVAEIEKLVARFGFESVRVSQINKSPKPEARSPKPIYILDTMGKLRDIYSLARVVFVGGSLAPKGGHNIIEPAIFKKPIIFGPYTFNFQDITEMFIENKAAILVKDKDELCFSLNHILENPKEGVLLGERAYKLVNRNRGATSKTVDLVEKFLKSHPLNGHK